MPVGSLNSSDSPQFFSIPKASVSTSFQSGEMNYTGDDKNASIDGKGFFQVQLPNGITAVTRDGEFRVNSHGQLVTKEGYTVMGEGGAKEIQCITGTSTNILYTAMGGSGSIQLDTHNHNPLSISSNGEVRQGAETKGKLSLIDFENPQLLTPTNGVYFLATNPNLVSKPATCTLRDGYVEGSNANSLAEMSNMMSAMRTFEANQHVIQIQDERLGKVISDLGNPS
jgi:flagellar basal-body rod protein FlgG